MKLNYKRVLFVGFAFFLICAFWQAYDSIVPMMLVNKFGLNQTASGAIMALDNVLAVVLLPIFGSLSDKTNTKYGKRTPYILIGTVLAVVAFMGMTFADNAQLNNLYHNKDKAYFVETVWEENNSITLVEGNNKNNTIKVKDYMSKIYYNKDYSELSDGEKTTLFENFVTISQDNKIMYAYDSNANIYKIDNSSKNSIYTNVFVPARTAHSWNITKSNPAPIIIFIVVLFITLLSMSVFRSPAVALMPDVTVKPLRSKANAVINLLGTAGGILVLLLGIVFGTGKINNQMMSYSVFVLAVVLIMVFGLAMFIFKVREKKWAAEMEEEQAKLDAEEAKNQTTQTTITNEVKNEKLNKGKLISLLLILASVALWYMGYNAVTSKYSLYSTTVLGKDYNTTLLIAQAAAIVSYIPVGLVASKFGRKKTILAGVLCLGLAFFSAIFIRSNSPGYIMYIIFSLAGIGWATINVNSFPMVVELAKGSDVGKYTGYYYTASMAAQTLTPILSGVVMDLVGNMLPLFIYATIFVLGSFVTMFFVKHGDSRPEKNNDLLESFDTD